MTAFGTSKLTIGSNDASIGASPLKLRRAAYLGGSTRVVVGIAAMCAHGVIRVSSWRCRSEDRGQAASTSRFVHMTILTSGPRSHDRRARCFRWRATGPLGRGFLQLHLFRVLGVAGQADGVESFAVVERGGDTGVFEGCNDSAGRDPPQQSASDHALGKRGGFSRVPFQSSSRAFSPSTVTPPWSSPESQRSMTAL